MYTPYNENIDSYFGIASSFTDTRASRNFEELICERYDAESPIKHVYNSIFEKINEKLFICSEIDDTELTEKDIELFSIKYNMPQTSENISKIKREIAVMYLKKTENEVRIQESRRLFETFSTNISQSLKSIDEITKDEHTEKDVQLKELLNERIEWYYKKLDLEQLVNDECIFKLEFQYLKKTLMNLSQLQPTTCSICMENQISWFIDPCGHTFCTNCKSKTEQNNNCHYCRTKKRRIHKLYL